MAGYTFVRRVCKFMQDVTKEDILDVLNDIVGDKASVTESNLAEVDMIVTEEPAPANYKRYLAIIDNKVYVCWTLGNTLMVDRYTLEVVGSP